VAEQFRSLVSAEDVGSIKRAQHLMWFSVSGTFTRNFISVRFVPTHGDTFPSFVTKFVMFQFCYKLVGFAVACLNGECLQLWFKVYNFMGKITFFLRMHGENYWSLPSGVSKCRLAWTMLYDVNLLCFIARKYDRWVMPDWLEIWPDKG
jgi:hypothetical protein